MTYFGFVFVLMLLIDPNVVTIILKWDIWCLWTINELNIHKNHAFAYLISKNIINLLWIYVSEYICNDYDGYDTNIRYPGNTHMQVNSNRNA